MRFRGAVLADWRTPLRRLRDTPNGRLLGGAFAALIFGTVLGGVVLAQAVGPVSDALRAGVERSEDAARGNADLDVRSKIFAADGSLIAILHGEENREPVPLRRVPEPVRAAVIAVEDERFYEHDGVDPTALMRAFLVDTAAASVQQGGGTITMQLARNAYLQRRERTLSRKWEEIVVARRLEARMTKEQILEQYLNTVYFGAGAYGIQAAAEAFFGAPVGRLSLAQGAMLAGLIKSPRRLDPRVDLGAALDRRHAVLARMRSLGLVDDARYRAADAEPVRLARPRVSNGVVMVAGAGASFVEYVKQALLADPRLGATAEDRRELLFNGGLRVTTTLDLDAQRGAERAIADVLDLPSDPAAALVSIEPSTGEIRAMAGGRDARGFNLASQGRRQPGSAFKPFTLVAALERGISVQKSYDGSSPQTIDVPGREPWIVRNYEGSASGTMSLLRATELSVNAVYAQVVMDAGPDRVVDVARRMGIASKLDAYPSIALGALTIGVSPLEMASAYATLANDGTRMNPLAIKSVVDGTGKELVAGKPDGTRALAPSVAAQARAVLEGVVRNGTGRRALGLGRPAAGKTGTTDSYRDSWFVGFTPQLSTAVWLGYPRPKPLYDIHGYPKVFGGSLPCEIWTRFMRMALDGSPAVGFSAVDLGGSSTVARRSDRDVADPLRDFLRKRRRRR